MFYLELVVLLYDNTATKALSGFTNKYSVLFPYFHETLKYFINMTKQKYMQQRKNIKNIPHYTIIRNSKFAIAVY